MNQVENELMHYGVLGMKWGKHASAKPSAMRDYGKRIVRGRAGPGVALTGKRQVESNKVDLKTLDNGGHLSVGLTKKRQEAYDQRDRNAIAKSNDRAQQRTEQQQQNYDNAKKALKIGAAVAGTALAAYGTYKVVQMVKEGKVKKGQEAAERLFQARTKAANSSYSMLKQSIDKHGSDMKSAKYGDKYGYYEYLKGAGDTYSIKRHDWNSVTKPNDVFKPHDFAIKWDR